MKTFFWAFIACTGVFLYGCGVNPANSAYVLELPELPRDWEALLGSPHWRVEWVNAAGQKEAKTVSGSGIIRVELPQTWASAVRALPFWPKKGIGPGIFRPAGAIFPHDVQKTSDVQRTSDVLFLSWQGGVDANLFWELAAAYSGLEQEAEPPEETALERAAVLRLPWNFNWPRFRELFDDPSLNEEVRADPWLADWRSIAAKIVQSGFDKRRLVPEPRSSLRIPAGPGPWIGTSPFAAPLLFEEGTASFSVRPAADTWVSPEGLLRCNTSTWIFISWEE